MEYWIILGLLAAVFFGSSAIAAKVATGDRYFGLDARAASILTWVGITVVLGAYFLKSGPAGLPSNPKAVSAGVLAGVLWAVGQILLYTALSRGGEISRLAPIYNMNTLVAVVLGILLLGELPSRVQALRVLFGALLITVGGIFVIT